MDLNFLSNFITVVNSGSISAAAKKLYVAQPALSLQLQRLEKEYGAKLITTGRGQHSLKLTAAGEIFYDKAREIVNLEKLTRQDIQDCQSGISGTLKLSISPSRAHTLVDKYMVPFSAKYPNVKYFTYEEANDVQIKHLLAGVTDFAITNAPIEGSERFDIIYERQEPVQVVLNKNCGSPLLKRKSIRLRDLARLELAITADYFEFISVLAKRQNVALRCKAICVLRETTLHFAYNNICAALNSVGHDNLPDNVVCIPLNRREVTAATMLYKLKGKKLPAVAELFLQNCSF